ncbi:flavodoxin [Nocardioides currus]|uniref:Flavodoxin n=1 Tax=Nocardioides currus TaxID=2133958 RepID=A0A2R7YU22_9ACTN|nr:flavodoxin [Nocardioides currus]
MRALVVFESMFGNTARAADAVAQGLRGAGVEVEVVDVRAAPALLPPDLDLLVVGAPTHAFGLSRPATRTDAVRQGAPPERAVTGIREWLESLEVPSGSATPLLAAFDTHATRVRWSPWSASSSIAKVAARRGLGCDARLGLVVDDVAGPLVDGERERAVDFGAALAARCRSRSARPG